MQKLVQFSSHVTIIHEPIEMAEDLAAARDGCVARRRADKERMETMISKILQTSHRESVYKKLYVSDVPNKS